MQRLAERAQKVEAAEPVQTAPCRPAARLKRCRTRRAGGDRRGGRSGGSAAGCSPRPTATSRFARSRRSRHCSRIMISRVSRPRSLRRLRPSSRKRPNARRFARQGCRSSKTCRCRPRTKSGRPAAKPRKSIRRRPGCRCCSASPMSASAAATKRPSRRSRPAPRVRPCAVPPLPERKPQRSVTQQIASSEPVSEYARRPAPQGSGRSWSPGTCCRGATGRRSFGYPRVPAPPVQLKFVTILMTKKVPAVASRDLVFWLQKSIRITKQAIDIK